MYYQLTLKEVMLAIGIFNNNSLRCTTITISGDQHVGIARCPSVTHTFLAPSELEMYDTTACHDFLLLVEILGGSSIRCNILICLPFSNTHNFEHKTEYPFVYALYSCRVHYLACTAQPRGAYNNLASVYIACACSRVMEYSSKPECYTGD